MAFPIKKFEVAGSKIEKAHLPRDFYRFLCEVGAVATHLSTENDRFRQSYIIAGNILAVQDAYLGKTSRECFQMFYEHIQQPYKTIRKEIAEITGQNYEEVKIHLGLSLSELKQIDIGREYQGRVVVESHTAFTRGGFEIKEWRLK